VNIKKKIENKKENSWHFYVLLCSDNSLYAGITTDLKRRLDEHNSKSKGAKYTKVRRPVKLVYQMEFPNRSLASRVEYGFKSLNRKMKMEIINENSKLKKFLSFLVD
tara:strand:- start:141 stop:461 length:321 start_codon:yes stop_codon:yes gene_type:complete